MVHRTEPEPTHHMLSNSEPGRRLACERCRGQKLKCERSNIPDCCQRCRKADVQCSFVQARPPGRPRIHPLEEAPRIMGGGADGATEHASVRESTSSNPRAQEQAMGQAPKQAPGPSETTGATTDPLDADSIVADMLYDDVFTKDFGSAFGPWSGTPMDTTGSSTPYESDALWSGLDSLASTGSHTGTDSTAMSMHQPGVPSFSRTNTAPPVPSLRIPESHGCSSSQGPNGSLVALVQRVTEIGNAMHELHSSHSLHGDDNPDHHSAFPVEICGKVLLVANKFLSLLRCFFSDELNPSNTPMPMRVEPRRESLYTPYHDTFNQEREFATGVYSTNDNQAHSMIASLSTSRPRRIYGADKPSALQLIASYQRLLDLYLLLYKSVSDHVRRNLPRIRQSQPIWGDLNIGGAPLHQFPDLHIKLLLQCAARLQEEVEGALGLPEGCRVSRKSPAEGDGILGTIVTSHFVEMCLGEETAGTEQGRSVITRIREITTYLATVLDSPSTQWQR
ncbi:hypothetical protein GGR56DRAFT_661307 [Xylariaceae sp. FL0804]|nr:hypothetical protein GGR56DRAFT_661307 [Xylariaceae sp. FL0804]